MYEPLKTLTDIPVTKTQKGNNLLIIMSDEHRRDAMGCMGHPTVKTPHLDALAARGTVFENAYTPCPMCVPARASVATGEHVHKTRHWDSATPYDGKQRSWMRQIRDQGVDVVSIGKLHFRSTDDDNGFSEEISPMHVVGGIGWTIGLLREDLPSYDCAAELADDVGYGETSYTRYDEAITSAAEQWLKKRTPNKLNDSNKDSHRDNSSNDTELPWVAFVSLVSPHYPLKAPKRFYDLYANANIKPPVKSRASQRHPELGNIASFFNYQDYFDVQRTREAQIAYFGLTSFMDDCVGRIISALDQSGQTETTDVVYVSDHGEMLGDHGLWTKQVMFEASAGVPMIAAGPSFPVNTRISTPSTLLDLAATAIDVTGSSHDAISEKLPGLSLKTLAETAEFDRTVLSEYHDGGSTTATFMVRWKNWKYIHYVGFDPQLFDLAADPDEQDDLALNIDDKNDSSELAKMLLEGERRLREFCDPTAINDLCFSEQKKHIESLGGEDACLHGYSFNHTPAPVSE